jgi:RNA polymerase sigma factor (sigma-70 family)
MEHAGFEELCREQHAPLTRAAYLIVGDREEALDIAQETFARALERWDQVRVMDNPVGWLYRVATNLAISRRRRLFRRPAPRYEPLTASEPSDPSLARALARLTPAQRSVIVWRFYLDRSVEETAAALKKAPGTVKALTSQGMAKLRNDLGETWLEVTDG